jgi:hypothetical protein
MPLLQVEELLQTKPAAASMDPSGGAAGISMGSSKLDVFTKKLKDTMVELINADLSQPISQSHGHSPLQLTPRQQPEQQPPRSSMPSTPRQQQQPQQQQQSPAKQPPTQQQQVASSSSAAAPPQAESAAGGGTSKGSSIVQQPGELHRDVACSSTSSVSGTAVLPDC